MHTLLSIARQILLATVSLLFSYWLWGCQQSKEVQKSYYNDGKLLQEMEYEKGVPDGKFTIYYPDGKVKGTGTYKQGKLDSVSTGYYPNGQVKSTKYYQNGLAEGKYENFHENGNLISSGQYRGGVRTGYTYDYFRDEPRKVKKKLYYYNFQGKEAIGYAATYQRDGRIDELNPGKVLVKVPGDTLKVGQEAQLQLQLADKEQELQAIVLGKYDDQFKLTDPQSADTIRSDGKKVTLPFTAVQAGVNPLRAKALILLTSVQNGNTKQITVKPIYFEYPLYAK